MHPRYEDGQKAHAKPLLVPQAFEVNAIAELQQEIFGPVLHIVRWSGDPQAVIDQINALGYGLTISQRRWLAVDAAGPA